jgi:hypothetical protein
VVSGELLNAGEATGDIMGIMLKEFEEMGSVGKPYYLSSVMT